MGNVDKEFQLGPAILVPKKFQIAFGMPVYNQAHEGHFPIAVDSILAQTHKDFSLVIVDDASTDGTWELVQKTAQKDKRIKIFRNDQRLGSVGNFRRCFELAQPNDYFAWASQHDWYESEWLEEMLRPFPEDSQIALVYPWSSQHKASGEDLQLPLNEFETVNLDVQDRVLKTIWSHEGAGSMVYGLFRADLLRRCGVYRRLLFPDIQLLIELAFLGSIRQVPRLLWHRRVMEGFSFRRQLHSGFACPPWYCRFSIQLINSWALLWHRSLSPYAGSLSSRYLGWVAAQEYFLANPRYPSNLRSRRPIWLTREFLYGDLGKTQKKKPKESSMNQEADRTEEEFAVTEVKRLTERLKQERRLREELKSEIALIKLKLFQTQKRYLQLLDDQMARNETSKSVHSDVLQSERQ